LSIATLKSSNLCNINAVTPSPSARNLTAHLTWKYLPRPVSAYCLRIQVASFSA
jgi:hypothetical protein